MTNTTSSTIDEHAGTSREHLIRKRGDDARRWSRYVDTLIRAFHKSEDVPPSLVSKIEALRNKRDTVVTKVHALERHKNSGWPEARRELEDAQRELRDAWRSVIGTLDRESLFV